MNKYIVTVPPTAEQGSYTTAADSRADALWYYNSARAHDGLPPLRRMPAGTVYAYQRTADDNAGAA
jgi:hypothetical protein